jgi:hypothetical protein
MPVTRAAAEAEVVSKLKGLMSSRFVSLSTASDGSNPDLNGPLRRAILYLGGSTVDPIVVTDADFVPFAGWQLERLIDVARIETLKVLLGQLAFVDTKVDGDSQALSQLAAQIKAMIADLESAAFGPTIPVFAAGTMTSNPYIPNDPFAGRRSRSDPARDWPYP